jgi:hypothetical protein
VYVSFPDENTPVEEVVAHPTIIIAIVKQRHNNRKKFLRFMVASLSSALILLDILPV